MERMLPDMIDEMIESKILIRKVDSSKENQ